MRSYLSSVPATLPTLALYLLVRRNEANARSGALPLDQRRRSSRTQRGRERQDKKVTFLTVIPSPYQRQLFRRIADSASFQIQVFYYAAQAGDRQWNVAELEDFEAILPGTTIRPLGSAAYFNPSVVRALAQSRSDVVVVSDYSIPTAQMAMRHLIGRRTPWVFWGEVPGLNRRGPVGNWIRQRLQSPLRSASAIAAIGSGAVETYGRLFPGVPVHNIPYFCDLDPFTAAVGRRAMPSSDVNVLFSGQLIHRKGVDVLVDAFVRSADAAPSMRLQLMGSGPDRAALEGRIPPTLRDRVSFLGHRDPADLPGVFAQADIFVLPSRHDGWGVVVNEALAAGLPIVASNAVGAARDLVVDGENGFVVESGSVEELAGALTRLASSAEMRAAFGRASSERAARWGLDEGVRRWEQLVQSVLN